MPDGYRTEFGPAPERAALFSALSDCCHVAALQRVLTPELDPSLGRSRNPSSPVGRRLVPHAARAELECDGAASDHQPLVVDLEAIAFDAGE